MFLVWHDGLEVPDAHVEELVRPPAVADVFVGQLELPPPLARLHFLGLKFVLIASFFILLSMIQSDSNDLRELSVRRCSRGRS